MNEDTKKPLSRIELNITADFLERILANPVLEYYFLNKENPTLRGITLDIKSNKNFYRYCDPDRLVFAHIVKSVEFVLNNITKRVFKTEFLGIKDARSGLFDEWRGVKFVTYRADILRLNSLAKKALDYLEQGQELTEL